MPSDLGVVVLTLALCPYDANEIIVIPEPIPEPEPVEPEPVEPEPVEPEPVEPEPVEPEPVEPVQPPKPVVI